MKDPAESRRRRPAPAPRRSTAAPAAAPRKKNLPLLLGVGGGGAALLLVIVVVIATSGSSRPEPAPAPPRPAAVRPPAAAPPPSKPEDVEARMRRETEEARRKFIEEQARVAEEEKRRRIEEQNRRAQEAKAAAEALESAKAEAAAKDRTAAVDYAARKRERRAESARAHEEAKKAVEENKKAEAARQKSLAERLRTLRLTVRLKNGMVLEKAGVLGITGDELRLAFTFEGAQAEQAFPTDFVDDRSFVELLHAAYRDLGAEGWYEVGRHLVLRRQWREAKDAFDRCAQADAAFAPRIPDLTRVLNNEAAFKGSARRIGADRMVLAYDFSDPTMAQDFTARQPATLAVEEGELKLSGRGSGLYSLKDVEFDGELDVDLQAVLDETGTLALGAFFTADRKGYLVVLNHRTEGNVLYRLEGGALQTLAKRAQRTLAPGAEARVRWAVRHGTLRVWVGEEEVLSATDAGLTRGWFILGGGGGTLRVRKLTVQGRVQPAEIQKRFAEAEVLVRRALESGLGARKKTSVENDPLWGEDPYLLGKLDPAVREEFQKRRAAFLQAVQERKLQPPHAGLFDPVTEKAPDFAAGWYWRGRARRETRRYHEAREAFVKAAELEPDFAEAHAALAQACLDDRDVAAARTAVGKALSISPGDGAARALEGFLRFVAGDPKGAVAELEVARALEPADDGIVAVQRNVQNVMKGPQHLGAKFVKEFPHFVVMTDMSREKTELYGARLEAAYRHFAETFKESFKEDPSRSKPRVAIFNTREAYLTYGELTLSGRQEWTLGYFHPLFRELLLFEDVDIDATLHTLYHEAFHHFLSLLVPRPPFWYNEGIAEYMGAIRIEASKKEAKVVEKAKLLGGRLTVLKAGMRFALPFKQIMLETPGQFYSGPVSFKYAQAWAMVHFFYEGAEGRHRPRIEAYFRALRDGKDGAAAFEAGFADADLESLQKAWADYVKALELPKR